MNGKDIWKEFAAPMALLILFVIAIFGVFGLTKTMTKKPELSLSSGDNIVTDQSEVPVTGVVKNTSKLTVNDTPVAVGQDGSFSTSVPVSIGENNVSVVAGDSPKVTQNVKVTREEVAKATTSASVDANGNDLTTSGPAENAMGSVGLAAIVVSLAIYYKSRRQKPLQKAVSLV